MSGKVAGAVLVSGAMISTIMYDVMEKEPNIALGIGIIFLLIFGWLMLILSKD